MGEQLLFGQPRAIPDRLYRYRSPSPEYIQDEIIAAAERSEIWFSRADTLNDPFDHILSVQKSSTKEIRTLLEKFRDRYPNRRITGLTIDDAQQQFGLSKTKARKAFEISYRNIEKEKNQ